MEGEEKTFGQMLADTLAAKGYSAERLAAETGISDRFINLFLEDRMNELPPSPYLHGYIVRIGEVLGFDGERVWQTHFKDRREVRRSGARDILPQNRFALTRMNMPIAVIAVLIVAAVGYILFRTYVSSDLTRGLTLEGLGDETLVVGSPALVVRGAVDGNLKLTVNDADVYPGRDGTFSHSVSLSPGMNAVVFELEGLLGRTGKVVKYVFFRSVTQN